MDRRAAKHIDTLGLAPHPEGGHFAEVFRSRDLVRPADGRGERSALTVIHFLLAAGERSRWHVVRSDELWTFQDGEPLELLIVDPGPLTLARIRLGPGLGPCVVPAGHWQAARPLGAFALVACAVGPGFDYEDFALLSHDAAAAERLRRAHHDLAELL